MYLDMLNLQKYNQYFRDFLRNGQKIELNRHLCN